MPAMNMKKNCKGIGNKSYTIKDLQDTLAMEASSLDIFKKGTLYISIEP